MPLRRPKLGAVTDKRVTVKTLGGLLRQAVRVFDPKQGDFDLYDEIERYVGEQIPDGAMVAEARQKLTELKGGLADIAQQQELNNASTAANLGRRTAPSVAAIGAEAGLYNIISGPDAGQVWERLANGAAQRRPELEAASANALSQAVAARPAYSIAAQGSAQAALSAAPVGSTVDLSSGQSGLTAGLTMSGEKNVTGGYWNAPITAAPTLNAPLMTVSPPPDGQSREGFTLRNTALLADGSGQTALRFDLQGNKRMNRGLIENNYLRSNGGWACEVLNEANSPDAFATTTFQYNAFHGGVKIRGGGDSLNFIGNGFYGPNQALSLELISQVDNAPGVGDSSLTLIMGSNSTANKGFEIIQATRPRLVFNNLESGAGPGTDDALISLRGRGGAVIEDAYIVGNFLSAATAKYTIRLGVTNQGFIGYNTMGVPGLPGNANIYTTADAKNTIIGPNIYLDGSPPLRDEGAGTMGAIKPLPLGPGVTTKSRADFIKRETSFNTREGIVTLYGAVSCANRANIVIGILPTGFIPAVETWYLAMAQDDQFMRGTAFVYVDTGGNISLAQAVAGLSGTLTRLELSGLTFPAPLVQ